MIKGYRKLIIGIIAIFGISLISYANAYDVFIPISKYIKSGNANKLSAWFADNLEIEILKKSSDCSKKQALQIMSTFFKNYTPSAFKINHQTGSANMKYAAGKLKAGGKTFMVTIFVHFSKDSYKIQHLKIELVQ